jgi:enoyl-[acyl-carrier-protein] reductase (NADH)
LGKLCGAPKGGARRLNSVFPEDVAEAVYFLASDMSAKSTGNIINVDAGNAVSFTR